MRSCLPVVALSPLKDDYCCFDLIAYEACLGNVVQVSTVKILFKVKFICFLSSCWTPLCFQSLINLITDLSISLMLASLVASSLCLNWDLIDIDSYGFLMLFRCQIPVLLDVCGQNASFHFPIFRNRAFYSLKVLDHRGLLERPTLNNLSTPYT